MNEKAFQTFTRSGLKFLAIPADGGNITIIDENGDAWGTWMSMQSFDQYHYQGNTSPIGKCYLSVRYQ